MDSASSKSGAFSCGLESRDRGVGTFGMMVEECALGLKELAFWEDFFELGQGEVDFFCSLIEFLACEDVKD